MDEQRTKHFPLGVAAQANAPGASSAPAYGSCGQPASAAGTVRAVVAAGPACQGSPGARCHRPSRVFDLSRQQLDIRGAPNAVSQVGRCESGPGISVGVVHADLLLRPADPQVDLEWVRSILAEKACGRLRLESAFSQEPEQNGFCGLAEPMSAKAKISLALSMVLLNV